jgi:ubiquinone biosynthesis protein COQ9
MSRYVVALFYANSSLNLFCSSRLLKLALPLVRTHGFTREALSRSVLSLPANEVHSEPLSDTAVSALFGHGDDARKTLIEAWLEDGLRHMGSIPGAERPTTPLLALETFRTGTEKKASVKDALRARLEYNEPALPYLPEVRSYSFLFIDYFCSFM